MVTNSSCRSIPPGAGKRRLGVAPVNPVDDLARQVQTLEGRAIHSANALRPEIADGHHVVNLDLPAKLVSVGDYKIKLNGIGANGSVEPIASYYVRVSPR